MEVIGMAVEGSTVRLQAVFYNISGVAADCDDDAVSVKIYDKNKRLLNTYDAEKGTTGTYYYDFTIPTPNAPESYYYEFSGEIGGVTILDRDQLEVQWE
jgi:hypothetical protein